MTTYYRTVRGAVSAPLLIPIALAALALSFWFGTAWERSRLATDAQPAAAVPGEGGARCGGFIQGAPTCTAGFHCQLNASNPDTGGICVPDQTNIQTPSWTKGMTLITQQSNGATVPLKKNERFAVELGDTLEWALTFTPENAISRVPNSVDTGGFQGVYAADKAGTAILTAVGKPRCAAGMMCAQYLVEISVIFNVTE